MTRVVILWCLVLFVTLGVMVSFADNNEVKSIQLKKINGGKTDQSISKVNDDDDDHNDDSDYDHDNDNHGDDDHDNDNDEDQDHDHDNDKDDHDHDNDHDKDNDHDNDRDDDSDDGDNDSDNDKDDDDDDDDDDKDNRRTLGVHEIKKGNLTVKLTNRGASIMSLLFPDKNGKVEDIVLGYDIVNDYLNDTTFCGARVERIYNRREKTVANDGQNTIHGGKKGFGDAIWKVKKYNNNCKKPYIVYTYTSLHGKQGKLEVTATYKLVGENILKLVMEATAKKRVNPVNLVHQSYWNLGGHNKGDVLSEELQILGSGYAHVDNNLIPTGKILAVKGTQYDFLQLRPIKDNINELMTGHGINYYLDGVANKMRKVMELVDKKSKRKMELSTDQSGLTIKGKHESVHTTYSGLCLETQSFPNAINYQYLPSKIVESGKKYKHTMLFKFSITQ